VRLKVPIAAPLRVYEAVPDGLTAAVAMGIPLLRKMTLPVEAETVAVRVAVPWMGIWVAESVRVAAVGMVVTVMIVATAEESEGRLSESPA
jgi:hypothetical protein